MSVKFRSDRLITLRKAQNLTQADLAEALGISQNQISSYEREYTQPTIPTLIKMAHLFNTSTDYLIGLSNVPEREAEPEPHLNQHEADILALMRSRSLKEQARLVQAIQLLWAVEED